MKREILFRGKTLTGEWVEGLLHYSHGQGVWAITQSNGWVPSYLNPDEGEQTMFIEVNPETVGQFTGLLDINGKRIFEGDYDQNHDVVMWCERRNGWAMKLYDFPTKQAIFCHCYQCERNFEISEFDLEIEIIGNIHDNPELLTK